MSVRFQYAGDKDISAGRSGGASIFSLPLAGGFPEAGTILNTLLAQTYPIAEGGTSLSVGGINYPTQVADVYEKADGSGGSYLDWVNAFNVQYQANGTLFYVDVGATGGGNSVEVPYGSNNSYESGYYSDTAYFHDGSGAYYTTGTGTYVYYSGSIVSYANNQTEVPTSSGNYYDNGTTSDYVWDGNGGYTTGTGGAYYANGDQTGISGLNVSDQLEVPSGSGFYYNTGTQTGYTWDGSGGYNYPVTFGTVIPTGTFIYGSESPMGTQTSVEVPSGSGNFYDSEITGTGYIFDWSNSPNYYSIVNVWYPQSGTFIYNDGSNDYYWDGNGGFYI
jgi:hypothetical protein